MLNGFNLKYILNSGNVYICIEEVMCTIMMIKGKIADSFCIIV